MSKKFDLLEKFNQKGIVISGERVRPQLLNLIALTNNWLLAPRTIPAFIDRFIRAQIHKTSRIKQGKAFQLRT